MVAYSSTNSDDRTYNIPTPSRNGNHADKIHSIKGIQVKKSARYSDHRNRQKFG